MKGQSPFKRLFPATLLVAFLATGVSGCSIHNISDAFVDETELEESLRSAPRFWEDSVAFNDSSNLFKVHNVAFEGKPYNDIMSIGDNILMIGQGSYVNVDNLMAVSPIYEYSFDIYDPWKNEVVASLEHSDINCDRFQIIGDELFLFDDDSTSVSIYDSTLNFIETRGLENLAEISDLTFYSGSDNSTFYAYDFAHDCILSISRSSFDYVAHPVNMYSYSINDISEDGKYLLVSGVDRTTLQYSVEMISTESFNADTTICADTYTDNIVTKNGIFAKTSNNNNYWLYQSPNNFTSYFSLNNIWNPKLLEDSSLVFLQENSTDNTMHDITAYHIDPFTGQINSTFDYSYGQKSANEFDLLSNNYVYLKDSNCIMFLTYTQACMPELLVWDLSKEDKNAASITRFLSEEELALYQNISTPHDEASTNYGDTVTMIPDINSYDWGELEPLNKRATKLEDKYSIDIYMGEEVPKSIDYFVSDTVTDYETIELGLDTLENILSCYPDNFFKQLCYGENRGVRIYLTGEISGNSNEVINEPSGFVSNINSYLVMVLDVTYSWDWGYTVNHEISHMIDRRLDFYSAYEGNALFSEEKWNELNPSDFKYLNSYEGYEDNPDYDRYKSYFIDSYGTTYSTEDRAELFGTVMDDYISSGQLGEQFAVDSHYYKKMDFYCKCIRDGFETSTWTKKLPWELTK